MSSFPGSDLEDLIEDNYGMCTPEMLKFYEPYRAQLEDKGMDYNEEDHGSWRTYRECLWDGIPEFGTHPASSGDVEK